MKGSLRRHLVVLLAACAAAGTLAPAAAHAEGVRTPPRGPVVVVVERKPLVLQGFRFKRGELVSITIRLKRVIARRKALAGPRTGLFTARFPKVVERCRIYTITVVGNKGSRVGRREVPPWCRRVQR
ncbi:MAG: hypothetical protein ABR583_12760 [Gaiellaceae bacterium]